MRISLIIIKILLIIVGSLTTFLAFYRIQKIREGNYSSLLDTTITAIGLALGIFSTVLGVIV